MIDRQKIVGWVLIAFGVAYIAYFLKVRLLVPGPVLEKKEWINLVGALVGVFLGTINVRMAAMRERKRKLGQSR